MNGVNERTPQRKPLVSKKRGGSAAAFNFAIDHLEV